MLTGWTEDVWMACLFHLSVRDVASLHSVCRDLRANMVTLDSYFARLYATHTLHDPSFWTRASQRPIQTSRPLQTYTQEILRIEHLSSVMCRRLIADDIYAFWKSIDLMHHSPSSASAAAEMR